MFRVFRGVGDTDKFEKSGSELISKPVTAVIRRVLG